ncbi:MAG: protein kinase [Candidatus Schekmanbacteria bacterium]|nr:protein kinase [Candidatus Schekmanbacteria bacterium]
MVAAIALLLVIPGIGGYLAALSILGAVAGATLGAVVGGLRAFVARRRRHAERRRRPGQIPPGPADRQCGPRTAIEIANANTAPTAATEVAGTFPSESTGHPPAVPEFWGSPANEELGSAAPEAETRRRGCDPPYVEPGGGSPAASGERDSNMETRSADAPSPARAVAGTIFAPGDLVADQRHRVIRLVARGSMGEVYEVEDLQLGSRVALKTIRADVARDEAAAQRFKREIQLARKVTHRNVCRIFDFGTHAGGEMADTVLFLTMELLRGETLRHRLARSGAMTPAEALPIARQMAAALAAAHAAGVVHRDFKPANVMLESTGATGVPLRVAVTDFGLARDEDREPATGEILPRPVGDETLTVFGEILGTPLYMSPEQARGEAATPRSDVFAFGIVLHEMLTGKVPFDNEHAGSILRRRAVEAPRLQLPGAIPPSEKEPPWETVIRTCLDRDPERRYAHAAEVLAALEPSTTRRPRAARLRRASVAVLLAGGLAASIAVGLWLGGLLARERGDTTKSAELEKEPPLYRQVTFRGDVLESALSPDGQSLAFIAGNALYVQSATGGHPIALLADATPPDLTPVLRWSADGSTLLLRGRTGMVLVPRDGGPARHLNRAKVACFSPDGREVAWHSWEDLSKGVFRIAITDLASGAERAIALTETGIRSVRDLDWSAAGIVVADAEREALWLVQADGTGVRRVLEEKAEIASPRWSPDGERIYYLRAQGSTQELARIAVGSEPGAGALSVVARGLETNDRQVSFSADLRRLAFTRISSSSNLWEVPLDSNDLTADPWRQLTRSTSRKGLSTVSPDGRHVAFVSEEVSSIGLNILDMQEGNDSYRRLSTAPAGVLSAAWSPDGRQLALVVRETQTRPGLAFWAGDEARLWTIRADGTQPSRLTQTDVMMGLPAAWASPSAILYTRDGGLFAFDVLTGAERPLIPDLAETPSGGWIGLPAVAPDLERVAVSWNRRTSEDGLWIVEIASGKSHCLRAGQFYPIQWSGDGSSVYASTASNAGGSVDRVVRVPLDGSEPTLVFRYPAGRAIGVGSIRPGEERLIATVDDSRGDSWLIDDFDAGAAMLAPE